MAYKGSLKTYKSSMKHLLPLISTSLFAALLVSSCSVKNALINSDNASSEITPATPAQDNSAADTEEPVSEGVDTQTAAANTLESISQSDEAADTEGVDQKNVKLVVEDQTTAGQIIVKTVATARDGWVSIHQSREDGSIVVPESIGEARVDSGDSEDIVVDLWEAPMVNEKLWVLLHIDGGERGIYEFPGEDLPVKKNGEFVARSFTIQGEESEESEDSAE